MGRRTGANSRKKKGERVGRRRKAMRAVLPLLIGLPAAFVAGVIVFHACRSRIAELTDAISRFTTVTVTAVTVEGSGHIAPAVLLQRSGIRFPLTLAELAKICRRTMPHADPWIASARVAGHRAGTARVVVCERKPVAFFEQGTICFVDTAGVCMPLDRRGGLLPLVAGLHDSTGGDGLRRMTRNDCRRMNDFFSRAAKGDLLVMQRITQVHFMKEGSVQIMLEGSETVVAVDEANAAERLQRLAQIWPAIRNDSFPLARIDLVYQNLAFVTTEAKARISEREETVVR